MKSQHQQLQNKIRRVRSHWKRLILLSGLAKIILSTLFIFGFALFLDRLFVLNQTVRFLLLCSGAIAFVVILFAVIIKPLMKVPSEIVLARYLEEKHPQLEDRLVTAVELGGSDTSIISKKLLEKLLEDARHHIDPINLPRSLRATGAILWSSAAVAFCLVLGLLILSHFDGFDLEFSRLFSPWQHPNIVEQPELIVSPGSKRVPVGSSQEIHAELAAFEADDIILYYSHDDTLWEKITMDATTKRDFYNVSLFDLQNDTRYYIKAGNLLSDIYKFTVYDAPVVKRVDLTYTYPSRTGLRPKHEKDSGDIWAPTGTVVKIKAVSSKALKQVKIALENGKELSAKIVSDTLLTTFYTVNKDTYYRIQLTDADGLTNSPAPEYFVHIIPDLPPQLTIGSPGRDIKASMVEEVPISISILDDFGAADLQLFYSVNGSEEKHIPLTIHKSVPKNMQPEIGRLQKFQAGHIFYLEDLDVLPGDFISYYLKAKDANQPASETSTTDIFFIEVRPFGQEFYKSLSQGQGGSQQGSGGRLSQTQKEIIIATWKLKNKTDKNSKSDFSETLNIIVESQKNLQEVTQSTLFQMQQRNIFQKESGKDVSKYYEQALEAMDRAITRLQAIKLADAQIPEKESLQNLLRAEAQITEVQLQQARSQGAGNNATIDELAQLFENEMDKLKNKYETFNEPSQQSRDRNVNEALKKIKELARRQQDFNRRMRKLARKNSAPEEKKRHIEELHRQQEEIRRQTQELSRQMQNNSSLASGLPRDVQEQLRRASQAMNRATNNLRRNNPDVAAAKGTQALNRLKQLEDLLNKNQKNSLRQRVNDLEEQFQDLARNQQRITEDVEELSGEKDADTAKLHALKERKNDLKSGLANAESQLQSLSKHEINSQPRVRKEVRKLSQDVEKADLKNKIDRAEKLLDAKKYRSALQAERDIKKGFDSVQEKLNRLQSQLAESEEEKLDLALKRTRHLRENLESLRRQAQHTKQKNLQSAQAGPGNSKQTGQTLDPAKLDWMNNQFSKTQQKIQLIQESVRSDTSLTRRSNEINENIGNMVRTFAGGNPFNEDLLENEILEPLRELEAEIAKQLEFLENKEKLFIAREENVPPKYRDLVEKYYEALSKANK